MNILLTLVSLGLLVWQSSASVPAFTTDQQYIYDYDIYLMSGIMGKNTQFTGMRASSKVIIQNQGKYMYMKFENWTQVEFDKEVHDQDLYDNLETGPLPRHFKEKIEPAALYPIRFTMERGIVKHFEAFPEDPIWSINIKKSLLSVLQINFERVSRVRSSPSNYLVPDNNLNVYSVMEDGIDGECETIYHINSEPYYKFPYERVLNVTKHRVLDKCMNRPFYYHSNIVGKKCEFCNTKEPLSSTSTTVYSIRGDRLSLTIEKIKTTGTNTFTPTTDGQTILTKINRTMNLKEVSRIEKPITFRDEFVTYTSLAYNFTYKTPYEDVTDLDLPNYSPSGFHWDKNDEYLTAKIFEILERLTQDTKVVVDLEREHMPKDILYIIEALTPMNYNQVKELYMQLKKDSLESKQKELMRRFFIQILPLVGTNPTIKAILTLAEKDLVIPRELMSLFSALPMYVKQPSKMLIEYFYEVLTRFEMVETKKHVYSSMWLSFGSLLHKGCKPMFGMHDTKTTTTYHGFEKKPYISDDVCRKYNKEIYDKFLTSRTVYEQITFVKVLGNVRLDETLTYLRPIITGEVTYPFIVRKYAAKALREMASYLRDEVISLALPVYYNHSETAFMRIMAFELLMATKPKYQFFYSTGSNLKYDPSMQVASYVYSTFVAIANSTDPCYEKISKDLKVVLSLIPKITKGYDYSRKVMFDYFNDKYGFGGNTVLAWVGGKKSFIPEDFYVKKTSNYLGYKFDVLELSVDTRGFHKLYEKVFGPKGFFSPMDYKKSVYNLFNDAPRRVSPVDKELAEIDEALKFTPRLFDDIEAAMSLKILGEDVTFAYWDDLFFSNFFKNDYLYMPKDLPTYLKTNGLELDFHKIGLDIDAHYEIANEIGMPLTIDMRMPSYTKLTGNVKFDLIYPEDEKLRTPSHVKIDTDVHPLYTARSIFTFGFRTPPLRKFVTGKDTKIDIQFPVVTTLNYDLRMKKLNFKYIPTKTPYEIFRVKSLPYTYFGNYYKTDKEIMGEDKKTINYFAPDYYHEKDYKFGHNYFGVGLHLQATAPAKWLDMTFLQTFSKFTTKKSYTFDPHNYYTFWLQRLYNGFEHMTQYFVINPKYRPYEYKLKFEPHTTRPTTEFEFEMDFDFNPFRKEMFTDYMSMGMTPSVPSENKKTVALNMKLWGKGNVERKWTGKLDVVMSSETDSNRKVSFDFERSPIPDYDPNPFKVCYRGTTKFPFYTEFYSIENKDLKAEMLHDVSFGKDCNEKVINVKVVAEKTSQQKYLMEYPSEHLLRLKEKCNKHMMQGYNFSDECWELFVEHYNLRKYIIDVEYENLPHKFVNFTTRIANWFRHTYYDNMEYNVAGVFNPEKRIKIVANFSSYDSFADVRIYKPHENIFYKRIYYPYVFPTFKVLNTRINYMDLYVNKFFDYDHMPTCYVQGKRHFHTFDRLNYEFPLSKCYHVLFRDCSNEDKFTVLTKAIEHKTYTKVLKVLFGKHKVEILPVGESPYIAPLIVRVDGSRKTVTPTTPLIFTDLENEKLTLFTVRRFYNWFILKSKVYGFEIMFNGDLISSEVSVFHRGRLCGLCGEYNGEVYHEFKGPDGCVYHNETKFGYSYAIPDETCDIPVFKHRECVLPHAPRNMDTCNYYRNAVVYNNVPNVDSFGYRSSYVCFSRLPILRCSEGCKPTRYIKAKVGFHCLNARDGVTTQMIRLSKHQELFAMQSKSEDYYKEIEYPEACVKL